MSRSDHALAFLSLFTGAGGLDLGLEKAGFEPSLCVEIDEDSRRTLQLNRPGWRLSNPGDIHALMPRDLLSQAGVRPGRLALLAGGTPCQPFSKSNYWVTGRAPGLRDPRARTLIAYLDAVAALLPHVVLLENVTGIAAQGQEAGLELLLRGFRSINRDHRVSYAPQVITLNAADFGVPQRRDRVFVVATVDGRRMEMPDPTHGTNNGSAPFLTAWDAIGDLDTATWPEELTISGRWAGLLGSIPEGHNYLWHTPRNVPNGGEPIFGWRTRFWSFLLKLAKALPSWTIQAGPGPATGPFHWKNRLLSVEELCRLQTFPRGYKVVGSRRSAQRQVGNAVPSAIGELLGLEIRKQLLGESVRRGLRLLPHHRIDCPRPEPLLEVPSEFLELRSGREDHPGVGRGPGAMRRGRNNRQAGGRPSR